MLPVQIDNNKDNIRKLNNLNNLKFFPKITTRENFI